MKSLLSKSKKKTVREEEEQEEPNILTRKVAKKGIRCPSCKKPGGLTSVIVMIVRAPFAKGGGVKMAGVSVTHKTAKEAWEKRPKKIVCTLCGVKFTYVKDEGLKTLDAE